MTSDPDRYQFQSWWVRLWRRRYYIPVPIRALRVWWASRRDDQPLTYLDCLSICIGAAQIPMKWYHTWDEVADRLEKLHDFTDL